MSARDRILGRLRTAAEAPGFAASGSAASARQPAPRAAGLQHDEPVARFIDRAGRLDSTVARVAELRAVPLVVASYLQRHGLPSALACWPAYAGLDWAAVGIRAEARPARADDRVGLTGCFAAIAETGTLMLCSGPETPAVTSLLPETHLAIVPAQRVVRSLEEGFARLRRELGQPPRAVNLVSGPSRTGDIEQTITLGAHGPYRVHLLVVG